MISVFCFGPSTASSWSIVDKRMTNFPLGDIRYQRFIAIKCKDRRKFDSIFRYHARRNCLVYFYALFLHWYTLSKQFFCQCNACKQVISHYIPTTRRCIHNPCSLITISYFIRLPTKIDLCVQWIRRGTVTAPPHPLCHIWQVNSTGNVLPKYTSSSEWNYSCSSTVMTVPGM